MGKTKRGKSNNGTRQEPYDLSMPENWTIKQLRTALETKGISFTKSEKKSQLIKLLKRSQSLNQSEEQISQAASSNAGHIRVPEETINNDSPSRSYLEHEEEMAAPCQANSANIQGALQSLTNTVNHLAQELATLKEKHKSTNSDDDTLHAISNKRTTGAAGISNNEFSLATATNIFPSSGQCSTSSHHHQGFLERNLSPIPSYNLSPVRPVLPSANPGYMGSDPAPIIPHQQNSNGTNIINHQIMSDGSNATNLVQNLNPTSSFSQFGFAAEALPQVEMVSPQMRKLIIQGKDINLATLLIPYYSGPMTNNEKLDTFTCINRKPDNRLNKTLSIQEFIKAFGVYKNIMCEAYPYRRVELDRYERDIVDMGTRYPGPGFYEYHKQFSAQAAIQLLVYNRKVDWSMRNNSLYSDIFTSYKPNSCRLCNSVSHTSVFCPQQLNEMQPSSYNESGLVTSNKTNNVDSMGRLKKFHQGREICNNFNGEKGCFRNRCVHAHVCLRCYQEHPQNKCSNMQTKNGQTPRNNPNRN